MRLVVITYIIVLLTVPDAYCFESLQGQSATIPISPHPRLLMNAAMHARIMDKIRSDSIFARWHREILHHANRYLKTSPPEAVKTGRRMLSPANDFSKRMLVLSYAWQMTRQPAYLHQALRHMNVIAGLDDWNPEHFLDVAEMTFAMSIGYDWLFDGLEEQQRQSVVYAILHKGLMPSVDTQYNGWLDRNNNWNQVCNAAMIVGALAVFETDPVFAARIIKRSQLSNQLALDSYEPDGAWPEGCGYWAYGTHAQTLLYAVMETAFGNFVTPDLTRGFWKTPEYRLNTTGNSGRLFNYSDTDDRPKLNPFMFWLAGKREDGSLLWNEQSWLHKKATVSGRDLVFMMLWSTPSQLKTITKPSGENWTGRGGNPITVLRTGWTKDDWYLGIKGGSPSANHGHMDAGSFVLDAMGERWAIDPGTEDYHRLESNGMNIWSYKQESDRWKVTRYRPQSHNTLTVNNLLQKVNGTATFETTLIENENTQTSLNLTSLYQPHLRTATRTFSLSKKSFEATDQITNGLQPSVVTWRLLTEAAVDTVDDHHISLSRNGKQLQLGLTSSHPLTVKVKEWTVNTAFESTAQGIKVVEASIVLPPGVTGTIHARFSSEVIQTPSNR